jgi:NAD(P)-dependent dehydrogenase (short-subunit alcohol dehydrogenase family)
MGLLDSRVIVITGGSLGIGAEVAKACAAEGATVVLAARTKAALEKTLRELGPSARQPHELYPLDVSRYPQVREFARWLEAKFHQVQGLVNCAGIYGPIGKTPQVSMEKFAEAVAVNFLGTVYACQAILPLFPPAARKKIVNFSGGGAATPFPNYSSYATSKVAVARFTENLALELAAEALDVNCIAPGFVLTRFHEETLAAGPELASPGFYEATKKQIAGRRACREGRSPDGFPPALALRRHHGEIHSAPWDPGQRRTARAARDKDTTLAIDDKMFFVEPMNLGVAIVGPV